MEKPTYNHADEEAHRIAVQSKMTWGERYIWAGCAGVVVGLLIIAGILIWAVRASLDAEVNMQTARFVVRLVEKFVQDHNRWPASWKELEACDAPQHHQSEQLAAMLGAWPGSAKEVEKRVSIDFQADPKKIVREDTLAFDAIKPIGIHYYFQEYGDVESLQRTLELRMSKLNK